MNRVLKYASLATRQFMNHQRCNSKSKIAIALTLLSTNAKTPTIRLLVLSQFPRPFCSSGSNTGDGEDEAPPELAQNVKDITTGDGEDKTPPELAEDVKDVTTGDGEDKDPPELTEDVKDITSVSGGDVVQDSDDELFDENVVETKELVEEINAYFKEGSNIEKVLDMIFDRTISGKHEDSDEELIEQLRKTPLPECGDSQFEAGFDEAYSTDEEIPHLYNATEYTEEKLLEVGKEQMTAEKFDRMMKDVEEDKKKENPNPVGKGLEELVEDMFSANLPEDLKQKIEAKLNDGERDDKQLEEAYALFKEYEEKMKKLSPEEISQDTGSEKKAGYEKDPPGEGPILRWQTRVVLSPGGDAWHPKNRKVKVSVFVKELGLSKYAGKRLRALVGKRYNPGKDELTIVSERFEHREENRKDVLRILYALIDEAKKADKYVKEAYTAYTKERLKASEHFQERLRARVAMLRGEQGATVV